MLPTTSPKDHRSTPSRIGHPACTPTARTRSTASTVPTSPRIYRPGDLLGVHARDERERERSLRPGQDRHARGDRKSTRLNSSHRTISYAVFCLKKKKQKHNLTSPQTQKQITKNKHK